MRILIIRHAEPDYTVDGLTEKGKREAGLLALRLKDTPMDRIYLSPRGRAQQTAAPALDLLGRGGETLPWLEEFRGHFFDPDINRMRIPWDLKPAMWQGEKLLMDEDRWTEHPMFAGSDVPQVWKETCEGLDNVLRENGYVREGGCYRVVRRNMDTLAFFCHFGIGSAILSRLTHIPVIALWQGTCMLPSSITTVVTQEREDGLCDWRCVCMGDLTHLYAAREKASLYAMFPETWNGVDTTCPDDWPEGGPRDARPMW